MANLTLPEGMSDRQVALIAAAVFYAEKNGASYSYVVSAAEDFLRFLRAGS